MAQNKQKILADPTKPLQRLVTRTITVGDLVYRPFWRLHEETSVQDALDAMDANDYDLAGVVGDPLSHFVRRQRLESAPKDLTIQALMEEIPAAKCIEKSLSILDLFRKLQKNEYLFVLDGSDVTWLINRSDLAATTVSVAVLAHVAAIEDGIKLIMSSNSENVLKGMGSERVEKARGVQRSKEPLKVDLLDCFFLSDWLHLVRNTTEIRESLGFPDESAFRPYMNAVIELRNHTAHGRGILAGFKSPEKALRAVDLALSLVERVWRLVDEQQPIWDRFAETQILYSGSSSTVIAGFGAEEGWPWPGSVHVLTAWNPAGIPLARNRNDEANQRLQDTLRRHDHDVINVVGRSKDGKWEEDSFLITDIKRAQAAEIARNFSQSAIFEIDKDCLRVIRTEDQAVIRECIRCQ